MKQFNIKQNTAAKPNDRYWQFCVGSGHAALAHRADYQKQLRRVHEELGFQRVRFHGVFDDDMNVVQTFHDFLPLPGGKKVKTQSFYQVACVYDALLEIGIRPFVELGFMPSPLASGKRTVFHYKGNVTPPKDLRAWGALISDFVRFLITRYGKEEVEQWYFEVWNEPDLRGFFWTGSQQDYFALYKTTVAAIKNVNPRIRVGGPSTSQNRWVKAMRDYCQRERLPLDFLSTHHYPGDDVGLPMLTLPNLNRMLFTAKKHPGERVSEVMRKTMYRPQILPLIQRDSLQRQAQKAREEAGGIPLFYTEWNVNPTCTAPLHDTIQSSAFIIKHVLDCQYVMDACSFWCFSDIFEESTFLPEPFTGSFGLMNVYGIPKPSYWAFYLLNKLGEERLNLPTTHEEVELAAFRSQNGVQILLYRQSYPQTGGKAEEVSVTLETTRTLKKAELWRIDETHGNPLPLWEGMGSPLLLSKAQAKELEERSALSPEPMDAKQNGGRLALKTALPVNGVQLITLEFMDKEDKQ